MIKYFLRYNPRRCIACSACEVACKEENNIPVGIRWIHVLKNVKRTNRDVEMEISSIRCRHCEDPLCVAACPEGAIWKRDDGLVLINTKLCNGCKNCIEACPFDAMQFDEQKGIAEMCNMCVHRIDKGLEPSCVAQCPAKALELVT